MSRLFRLRARNPTPSGRWRQTTLALLAVVVLLDLVESIYHLTHRGLGSGITELVLALVLVTSVYLTFHARQRRDSVAKSTRQASLYVIAAAASVVLCLGVYHLTHQGLRSGVIELSMTGLLVILGYLIGQPQKN